MDHLLLNLFAFLRPIFFIHVDLNVLGLNLFEIGALVFTLILIFAFLLRAVLTKNAFLSVTDNIAILLIIWSVSIFLIYPEKSSIKELARFIIPFSTFIVAKNLIQDKEHYKKLLFILITGFTIPVVSSVILIVIGKGIQYVSYWTDLPRYEGVYFGAHNMAHNMAFLLMIITMYVFLQKESNEEPKPAKNIFLASLSFLALFCIYMSHVRTVLIGLLVFFAIFFYYFNKKLLITGTILISIVGVILSPIIVPRFFNDFYMVYTGKWGTESLGSNRPKIWSNNFSEFSKLSIDRQVAGLGIGNNLDASENLDFDPDNVRNSHNDYLDVMMQTGIVGAILFILFQIFILRSVLQMVGKDRYIFLSLFFAVAVMNLISNSYVARFGLAQMFYLALAYVELPNRKRKI